MFYLKRVIIIHNIENLFEDILGIFFFFFLDEINNIVVPSNKLSYTLHENLTHFTSYNIELYVCREWLNNKNQESNQNISDCSIQKAMTTAQTSKKGKLINVLWFYMK